MYLFIFPLVRTLLKAPAEAGNSQSFVEVSGATQMLKLTSLFSLTSYWFYPTVHPLKLPARASIREIWMDFNQAVGCNLGGLSFSVHTCSHLQPEKEGPSPGAGCWVSAIGKHPVTAIRLQGLSFHCGIKMWSCPKGRKTGSVVQGTWSWRRQWSLQFKL